MIKSLRAEPGAPRARRRGGDGDGFFGQGSGGVGGGGGRTRRRIGELEDRAKVGGRLSGPSDLAGIHQLLPPSAGDPENVSSSSFSPAWTAPSGRPAAAASAACWVSARR